MAKLDEMDAGRLSQPLHDDGVTAVEIEAKPPGDPSADADLVDKLPEEAAAPAESSHPSLSAEDLDPEMLEKLSQMYSSIK